MSERPGVRAQRPAWGFWSRRNKIIATVLVVLLVVAALGLVVVGRSRGGSSEVATKAVTTSPVTRQDLVDRKTVSGTLEFGDSRQLPARVGTIATSTDTGTSGGLAGSGSGSASTSSTIPVTVTLANPAAASKWDSAPVDVAMESSRVTNVLTVPVTALLALSGGGYGVQVVNGSGAALVGVTTGLFADGRVEVSGDGITEGTLVQVPAT